MLSKVFFAKSANLAWKWWFGRFCVDRTLLKCKIFFCNTLFHVYIICILLHRVLWYFECTHVLHRVLWYFAGHVILSLHKLLSAWNSDFIFFVHKNHFKNKTSRPSADAKERGASWLSDFFSLTWTGSEKLWCVNLCPILSRCWAAAVSRHRYRVKPWMKQMLQKNK